MNKNVFCVVAELIRRGKNGHWEMGYLDFGEGDDDFDGIHEIVLLQFLLLLLLLSSAVVCKDEDDDGDDLLEDPVQAFFFFLC
ncbi:hypothetical protein QVD17_25831 [Tagetes erecta]|uniref:Uncharacterized protein n=1 Tax=Tagetes erecta TaxID=13708 RepID=A0AAD8NI08_TARER|nr:hypothetical protein QVD17_25831 [Tagetes erecta]